MSSQPGGEYPRQPASMPAGDATYELAAPAPTLQPAATMTSSDEDKAAADALAAQMAELQAGGARGANWFFWIAGLSLVNSFVMHAGGKTYFVVGLAIILIADGIAQALAEDKQKLHGMLTMLAIGFAFVVAAATAGFGFFARRGIIAVFVIGMILYFLDGLIFLAFQDFMSAGFHVFALFCMWSGLKAYRQLNGLHRELDAV